MFEMHQMCGAADLDVPPDWRGFERIEQPARILVGHNPIPFASDQGDRRPHQSGIVTERAVPGLPVLGLAGAVTHSEQIDRAATRRRLLKRLSTEMKR